MGRDYASRGGKKPQQRRKQTQTRQPGLPGWLWGLIGLTAGLVIAVGLYVAKDGGSGATTTALPTVPRPAPEPAAAELPPEEEARFTFYEMLPNTRLVPRGDDYTPPEQPARADIAYAIQAGSFGARADADARRAEVALLGMESRIEPAKLDDGRSVYRVVIGPDDDFRRVKNRMSQLYDAGIESFFRRVDS